MLSKKDKMNYEDLDGAKNAGPTATAIVNHKQKKVPATPASVTGIEGQYQRRKKMTYMVKDLKTQKYVSSEYATRVRAQRRADKLDVEYGAHRYIVVSTQQK